MGFPYSLLTRMAFERGNCALTLLCSQVIGIDLFPLSILLIPAVAGDLPDLEVRGGGSTSVDITRHGIDKAYGMGKLVEITGIAPEDMLFIGDRLDEAGNDYPVKAAGYPTLAVSGWEECVDVIADIVKELRTR